MDGMKGRKRWSQYDFTVGRMAVQLQEVLSQTHAFRGRLVHFPIADDEHRVHVKIQAQNDKGGNIMESI